MGLSVASRSSSLAALPFWPRWPSYCSLNTLDVFHLGAFALAIWAALLLVHTCMPNPHSSSLCSNATSQQGLRNTQNTLFHIPSLPPVYCFPCNSCYFSNILNSSNYTYCLYFCLGLLGYKLYMERELCAYKVVLTLKMNVFYVINNINNKENHMLLCNYLLPVLFLFHYRSL